MTAAPNGFLNGLLLGLGAAGLLFGGLLPRPMVHYAGIEADWRSVGHDLSGSAIRFG